MHTFPTHGAYQGKAWEVLNNDLTGGRREGENKGRRVR